MFSQSGLTINVRKLPEHARPLNRPESMHFSLPSADITTFRKRSDSSMSELVVFRLFFFFILQKWKWLSLNILRSNTWESEKSSFAISNNIMDLDKNHQWLMDSMKSYDYSNTSAKRPCGPCLDTDLNKWL